MEKVHKVISLWQPWATLVAIGAKRFETRSWAADHRGPLLIHASKKWNAELYDICCREPFKSVLLKAGYNTLGRKKCGLPFGSLLAHVRLDWIKPVDEMLGGLDGFTLLTEHIGHSGAQERAFGDYSPGRYAWMLNDIEEFKSPIQDIRGNQMIWDWQGILPPSTENIFHF